jgi:hypothetical protein
MKFLTVLGSFYLNLLQGAAQYRRKFFASKNSVISGIFGDMGIEEGLSL